MQCLQRFYYEKIRGGIEDNSKIIFLISQQKHVVAPQQNRLGKTFKTFLRRNMENHS